MTSTAPRRRHSPAVYRRRRLVLLLAVLAVAVLVWLLIAQPWRGAATENDTAAPAPTASQDAATELPVPEDAAGTETDAAASPTPEAEPSPDPSTSTTAAAAPCAGRDLTVEALTDSDVYGSGQNPQLSIRLTNTGETDCTLNVGTTTQSFTIASGSDTWWRSTDCQATPSDMIVLLAAGQSVTSATPLVWDRTRSSVDTCDGERTPAPGGGASYHLSVEIGGVSSTQSAQFLLY